MANQVVQVVLRSEAANETQHLGNWITVAKPKLSDNIR